MKYFEFILNVYFNFFFFLLFFSINVISFISWFCLERICMHQAFIWGKWTLACSWLYKCNFLSHLHWNRSTVSVYSFISLFCLRHFCDENAANTLFFVKLIFISHFLNCPIFCYIYGLFLCIFKDLMLLCI